jgi:4-diphosphocytidyl-2-C-methyl-D-erythritol kinase
MFAALDQITYDWRDFPSDDRPYNDFERVAPCECLEWIDRLGSVGADAAGLSGSGSAVFGRYPDLTSAETAAALLREAGGPAVYVAHSLSREASLA